LISDGMDANCRLLGSVIDSGEVALSSSTGCGVSIVSLAMGSAAIASSISLLLAPMYGFPSLSARRQYHLPLSRMSGSGSLCCLVAVVT
jgi:hypothetical protein